MSCISNITKPSLLKYTIHSYQPSSICSKTFSSPTSDDVPINTVTLIFLLPIPLPLSLKLPILSHSCKWNHNIWSFIIGFFHLPCFQGSSVLQHIPVLRPLLWLNDISLYAYFNFVCSSFDGHFDHFHLFIVGTNDCIRFLKCCSRTCQKKAEFASREFLQSFLNSKSSELCKVQHGFLFLM